MYKKITIVIILLILLMSLAYANDLEPKDIIITGKQIKEISDTQNEVTYNLKIPFRSIYSYGGYYPTYGRIDFRGNNTPKDYWFETKGIKWQKKDRYESHGYLNSNVSVVYNKNEGIPIIESANVRLMQSKETIYKGESDRLISTTTVSVIDKSNGYTIIENNNDSDNNIEENATNNYYQDTVNPSVKSGSDNSYNSDSSSHYNIINFIIDIIGALVYLFFIIGALNLYEKKWETKHYILLAISLLIFIRAGNYKLLLVPIAFLVMCIHEYTSN